MTYTYIATYSTNKDNIQFCNAEGNDCGTCGGDSHCTASGVYNGSTGIMVNYMTARCTYGTDNIVPTPPTGYTTATFALTTSGSSVSNIYYCSIGDITYS